MGKEDDRSLRSATDDGDGPMPGAYPRADDIADPAIYTLGFMGWMALEGSFDLPRSRGGGRAEWDHFEENVEEKRLAPPDRAEAAAEAVDILLNGVLAAAHDGAWGFDDAAVHAQAQDIGAFLQRAAHDWRLCALELRSQISHRGATPVEGGTPGGALQRGWLNLRAALPGYDDAALLDACLQLQKDLLARLRDALAHPLPGELCAPLGELERRAARRLGQLATVRACIAAVIAQRK